MSSSPIDRVRRALAAQGLRVEITEFDRATATSQQAAEALGVPVATIVKSLVFLVGEQPVLVLASGANQVDTEKLGRAAGGTVRRADADRVKAATGFVIGGVAPVGHAQPLATYIDADLLRYDRLWAAAGSPYAVFPVAPQELVRVTGGSVVELRREA
ncbi:MAG TPA: YbaK/EbsC family protein [Anaerolineae bacterium]|nr:YbaK/EbsC family protein [Anaerolineae bacterium]HPL28200.1 YbaK/EbsC family protein [Anaerolineae bacterium]